MSYFKHLGLNEAVPLRKANELLIWNYFYFCAKIDQFLEVVIELLKI